MAVWPELSALGTGGTVLALVQCRRWLWRISLARRAVVFVVLVLLPGLAAAAVIASADPLGLRQRHPKPELMCTKTPYYLAKC
jgi:hypothetical protein